MQAVKQSDRNAALFARVRAYLFLSSNKPNKMNEELKRPNIYSLLSLDRLNQCFSEDRNTCILLYKTVATKLKRQVFSSL